MIFDLVARGVLAIPRQVRFNVVLIDTEYPFALPRYSRYLYELLILFADTTSLFLSHFWNKT
jgi:hypothetical protein